MGSSYNYSAPAFLGVSSSASASTTYTLRPPKPPIHNPYDKFPQSEFDAWIGGITGALRKALGQEPELEHAETPAHEVTRDNSVDRDESLVNDSFAEINARRQDKGKGKQCNPVGDSGFGAGVGGRDQPIHVDWDAEEGKLIEHIWKRAKTDTGFGIKVEQGSPGTASWTVEEEMDAEEVDAITQAPASPTELFSVTADENTEGEEVDDGEEGQGGPSIVTSFVSDSDIESGTGYSSDGDSGFEAENTAAQLAWSSGRVGPPPKYIEVVHESSDDDSEIEGDQNEDIIEIDEIDEDEDADDEYEEQLDDETISSPAHLSRQPASVAVLVLRADSELHVERPSGNSLSPNEARHRGPDPFGTEGEDFLTPGVITPVSPPSTRDEGDWTRGKQKGFIELDMAADEDAMPDVVGGGELIPSSSPTFQELPILRMLPTEGGPNNLQRSSLTFSSPMESIHQPLRERGRFPAADIHSPDPQPRALDDDLPASSPILSSPMESRHAQLYVDHHDDETLRVGSGDDVMDSNGLYDDIYTDPPQELYELDVGMLECVPGVVADHGEKEASAGPAASFLMRGSDAEMTSNNSSYGDNPTVPADDEECDELPSSHGDIIATNPRVSITDMDGEHAVEPKPQLIQEQEFDATPLVDSEAANKNTMVIFGLEPSSNPGGQPAQKSWSPPIALEAIPLEHDPIFVPTLTHANSEPSLSPNVPHPSDQTNTNSSGLPQDSDPTSLGFLPSPPPDIRAPTQQEVTEILTDITDKHNHATKIAEEVERGLTTAAEEFLMSAANTIPHNTEEDDSHASEVGSVPHEMELEMDGVRRADHLLEPDAEVDQADNMLASHEAIPEETRVTDKSLAVDSTGTLGSAARCESNDVRREIIEIDAATPYPQDSDTQLNASNADASDITIEIEPPKANVDGTTTPNSALMISSPPPNTLLGDFLPPVTADPNVPDPVFYTERQLADNAGPTQRSQSPPPDIADSEHTLVTPARVPFVLSMPSTPTIMLSPVGTPGTGRPTPVSIPIPASILMALHRQKSGGGLVTSGLFTPIPSVPTPTETSQETGTSVHESEPLSQGHHEFSVDVGNMKQEKPLVQTEPSQPSEVQSQLREEPSTESAQLGADKAHNNSVLTPSLMTIHPPTPEPMGPVKQDPSRATTPPLLNQMIMTQAPTHPILCADPYPYSLSTPSVDPPKDVLSEGSEAETEHDNSMGSSSTIEKEIGDIPEFGYPDLSDSELSETGIEEDYNILDTIHFVEEDTDADGDLDPEFQVHHGLGNKTAAPESEPKGHKGPSPQPATQPAPSPVLVTKTAGSSPPHDDSISSVETIQRSGALANKAEVQSIAGSESSITSRSTKRKRSPLPHSSRLTRSMSSKRVDTKLSEKNLAQINKSSAASISAKGKGKGKETLSRMLSRKYSGRPGSSASSSGASSTHQILRDDGRRASRESSVASTVTSDISSIQIQPSPTGVKANNIHQPRMVPPPLLHAHTFPRAAVPHHHHPPPSLAQARSNKQVKGVLAFDRIPTLQAADFTQPQPGSQHQSQPQAESSSQPSSSQRAIISSTSPVTRSNCRYHKISVPLEEGGPRVCFLVPGCSLGDRELMEEEEIEDHGDATHEDSQRIIRDIESLDFDPYLIGVLRQLVGVDLLREQEVFYLPQAGQELVRRSQPRKTTTESRISVSSRDPGTSVAGAMPSPPSSRAPVSTSGSAATSISFFRRGSESDEPLSDMTDSEDESEPVPTRPKPTQPAKPEASISMGPPKVNRLMARRSLRLGKEDEAESNLRNENPKPQRARRSQAKTNAGSKRSRMSEGTPGDETRQTKRPRMRGVVADEVDRTA